jgi:hypothetical protein
MSQKLRASRWRAGLACLALASTLSGAWLTVFHGSLDDDAACAVEWGVTRGPTHATVWAGSGAAAPHHCLFCHWLRSLRSLTSGTLAVASAIEPADSVRASFPTRTLRLALVRIPARSPPA